MAPLGGNPPLWLVEGLAEYTLYAFNERTGHHLGVGETAVVAAVRHG
jgi:hypothetical protein